MPSAASDGASWRPRGRKEGRAGAAQSAAELGFCPAVADLYHAHYRSLFRLAALLTGDSRTSEAVVVDSFTALHRPRKPMSACDGSLPQLRRLVVARSRRVVPHRRPAGGGQPPAAPARPDRAGGRRQAPRFEDSAVVQALRALPAGQREAVVLTLYLDLTDEEAAAAMCVSRAALRRYLAAAMAALRAALPGTAG